MSPIFVCLTIATAAPSPGDAVPPWTMEQTVSIALARNRDLIAAKLGVKAARVERIAARFYPNPVFSYSVGNIILGKGNEQGMGLNPGPFDQTVHTFGLAEVIDVWSKRALRTEVADRTIEESSLRVEDAIREITYAVRSAFADVVREQSETALARETRVRYDETVRISVARFRTGDISESELKKIELEGLKYQAAQITAELELDLARQKLAGMLAFPSPTNLPNALAEPTEARTSAALDALIERAKRERTDLRAVRVSRQRAIAMVDAQDREAYPDPSIGLSYTRDFFVVSGDNPHFLGLNLSVPLPIFDRNQAGIGRARVDLERVENEALRLEMLIEREVRDAVRRADRSRALLALFEGGMLERAENALRTAEKSYKAGAASLLELLEAQRTYNETRSQYLRTTYEYRQATIDVHRAVGGNVE